MSEEMVRPVGGTSNTEEPPESLFETLKEWGEYLNNEDIDVKGVIEREHGKKTPPKGPSPC